MADPTAVLRVVLPATGACPTLIVRVEGPLPDRLPRLKAADHKGAGGDVTFYLEETR